jgi:hypothetical protein
MHQVPPSGSESTATTINYSDFSTWGSFHCKKLPALQSTPIRSGRAGGPLRNLMFSRPQQPARSEFQRNRARKSTVATTSNRKRLPGSGASPLRARIGEFPGTLASGPRSQPRATPAPRVPGSRGPPSSRGLRRARVPSRSDPRSSTPPERILGAVN